MTRPSFRLLYAAGIVALAALSTAVHAQITSVPATPAAWVFGAERQIGPIRVVPVRDQVFMLASTQGNSLIQVGNQGIVVIDTMSAETAPPLLEAIRAVSPRPIVQIINTSIVGTGGNEVIGLAGRNIGGTRDGKGAGILAFETVLQRMSTDGAARGVWPTDTFFVDSKDLYYNGESIHLYHQPAAYSDGDSIVLLRRSDVVAAGQLFVPNRFPRFDAAKGGTINGVLAGLNRIIDLTVPEVNEEGGTMVVPGVGHLSDEADVADYRDMVSIVRDRIQDMVTKRMTLQQVQAARPTRDYDPLYGTTDYTGQMFVEAVFRSLTAAPQGRGR